MTKPSKVSCNVDLAKAGKQVGFLAAPHSRNDSGWGSARFPLAVIRNGSGPTVFFTGGNHGDEYEGPIALTRLIQNLDPARVQGSVIVMPYLNAPAVAAGTRLSPIDGVNMNRAFPGERDGTVTRMIADYLTRHVLPRADVVCDIHSGGKTMYFSPFGAIHDLDDKALMKRAQEALVAFDPPIALILRELDAEGMIDSEVEGKGKVFVTTELGGGGTTTRATLDVAEHGIMNLLKHFGVLEGKPVRRASRGLAPSRMMTMPDAAYVIADHGGLLEMLVDIDQAVREGQEIARIYQVDRPGEAPVVYRASCDGVLLGRAHPCLIKPGDFLAMVAQQA